MGGAYPQCKVFISCTVLTLSRAVQEALDLGASHSLGLVREVIPLLWASVSSRFRMGVHNIPNEMMLSNPSNAFNGPDVFGTWRSVPCILRPT